MTNTFKAERQRSLALFELGQITEIEHARKLRAIAKAETRQAGALAKLEAKRERNRRYYHRKKLKNQFLASLEQPA